MYLRRIHDLQDTLKKWACKRKNVAVVYSATLFSVSLRVSQLLLSGLEVVPVGCSQGLSRPEAALSHARDSRV